MTPAVADAPGRRMRLLALSSDVNSTIASIRLVDPLAALCAAQGHDWRMRSFHQATRGDLAWADMAVVQRPNGTRARHLAARLQAMGTPWVCDLDDLLTDVPAFSMHHQALHADADALLGVLRQAAAITVPVEPLRQALAQRLGPVAPPLFLVPNHAPAPGRSATHSDHLAPRATLVIAASDTVRVDFIIPALHALAAEPGFEVLAIGPVAASLAAGGIALRAQSLLSREAFQNLLATCINPIGLIPLDDLAFSRCKSPIKFFDYAIAGVPVLCSNVTPYREVVDDRRTGRLVDNDAPAWQAAVLELAASTTTRVAMAAAAATEVAARHNLALSVDRWRAVLDHIWHAAFEREPRVLTLSDRLGDAGDRALAWLRDRNRARKRRRVAPGPR